MRPFLRTSFSWLFAAVLPAGVAGQNLADHRYSTSDIEAGARIYLADCALCHGTTGDGVDGINLRLGRFRTARSDDDVRRVIIEGVSGSRMPSFDLSETELNGVVAYIRAGFDPSGVAVRVGEAARGQAIFEGEGRCVGCHRVNGVGGRRLAPDLGEIGITRTPAALQRTLLDPSSALLPINRPIRAVTRGGETIRGRRVNEDT